MTEAQKAQAATQKAHCDAVKLIVGDLDFIGNLKTEDFKVYRDAKGTPEEVAAIIITARAAR
ncbi:MAG: hypothetical protein WC322_02730 [Candidatus Paceibacterota bacterium]